MTPDPDELLKAALTDPDSFDAARTTRLVAQLEHDDAEVQRAASWALRFVAADTPSLIDTSVSRFQRALHNPEARPVVLRTLAVIAEHNQEAVAEIIDGATEADLIDTLIAHQIVAGYQPPELDAGGSVIADAGDETTSPDEIAVGEERDDPTESEPDDDSPPPVGHPPDAPPAKPPRLDRSLAEYEPETPADQHSVSATESIQFVEGGREFTATRYRAPSASSVDETSFLDAVDRWHRIDDHNAVARVVDYGTRPVSWLIAEQGATGSLTERDTPMSPVEARWILSQLADALQYAHAAGVLHGGLWPGAITCVNAIEDADAWPSPRVGNWGLREVFRSQTALFNMPRPYAAPEHIDPDRFGTVDAATDIYGLGVIGSVLLVGSPPVREDGTIHLAQDSVSRLPNELTTVMAKCLKPAKMERYASAAAFKRDLAVEGTNE